MILLSILLSLINPPSSPQEDVSIQFTFKEMKLGKPPLAMYTYDVQLTNNTDQAVYLVLPRNFDKAIAASDKVWGAQYDDFDQVEGATLFAGESVTVFKLEPSQQKKLSSYTIKSFQDKILKEDQTITLFTCKKVTVGDYALEEFMGKKELHDDNLVYQLKNPSTRKATVKVE